ncbi:MAG: glycosyltransferase [Planctomycetota bacterium]
MKVLFATMQFGCGYAQGTERYVELLARGLQRAGHAAVVLAGDPEQRGPALPLGAEVDQAAPDPGANAPPDPPSAPDPSGRRLRVLHYAGHGWAAVHGRPAADLLPILEREHPDLVHLANPAHVGVGLVEVARRCGVPVVITVMDHWWQCPKHSLWHYRGRVCDGRVTWRECLRCIAAEDPRPMVQALLRMPAARGVALPLLYLRAARRRGASWSECAAFRHRRGILHSTLRAADAVIFLSQGARDGIGADLSPARVYHIPVGLEPHWFAQPPRPASSPRAPGAGPLDPAQLTLGFVGALAEHKGPHVLLEALRRLNWTRTRVRLVGPAPEPAYLARLERLAQPPEGDKAPLNVEFVGRVPPEAVPDVLRSLDLLIVPSVGLENLPQIVLQAQAVGVPVLASDVAGLVEAVADPALLFEAGSTASLAERLAAWVRRPPASAPASPLVDLSTVEEMVARTLAIYEGLW